MKKTESPIGVKIISYYTIIQSLILLIILIIPTIIFLVFSLSWGSAFFDLNKDLDSTELLGYPLKYEYEDSLSIMSGISSISFLYFFIGLILIISSIISIIGSYYLLKMRKKGFNKVFISYIILLIGLIILIFYPPINIYLITLLILPVIIVLYLWKNKELFTN